MSKTVTGGHVWSPDEELAIDNQLQATSARLAELPTERSSTLSATYFILFVVFMMYVASVIFQGQQQDETLDKNISVLESYEQNSQVDAKVDNLDAISRAVDFTVPAKSNLGLSLYVSDKIEYELCLWKGSPSTMVAGLYYQDENKILPTDSKCEQDGLVVAAGQNVESSDVAGISIANNVDIVDGDEALLVSIMDGLVQAINFALLPVLDVFTNFVNSLGDNILMNLPELKSS